MASPNPPLDVFATPAHEQSPRFPWVEIVRFVVQRVIRVAVAALVLVTLGMYLLAPAFSGPWIAALAALGVALYLPTSAILFRARFLPREPEGDELDLVHGASVHAGDWLAAQRALAVERTLRALPLCLLASYAVLHLGPIGWLVGPVSVILVVTLALIAWRDAAIAAASVWIARDRPDLASEGLVRLLRWPWPSRLASPLRHTLAMAHLRGGRVDDALAELAQVRPSTPTRLLDAQARLGRDLEPARDLLARGALGPDDAEGLEALLGLHEGRSREIRALRARWDAERDAMPRHRARFRDLLLAAALAPDEPGTAQALLARSGWTPARRRWIQSVWPAVAARLGALHPDGEPANSASSGPRIA